MAAGKIGRRLAALGVLALLAVLLGACWMLRPARLEGAVEQAVTQTRQAAQPPGADGGFQLLGVHWLEQEGGYLIAVDYAVHSAKGTAWDVEYYRWRRWGSSLERLESRSQRGLAQIQLQASLDSRTWRPGEDPENLASSFSWQENTPPTPANFAQN